MRKSNELQIGKAGEYIVCADLIIKNYIAFLSEQGLPYDIVMDSGEKLFRVQVKTTLEPRKVPQRNKDSYAYIFNIQRHGNQNNLRKYNDTEVDFFALVALDTKQIAYIPNYEIKTTMNFRVPSLKGNYYDEQGVKIKKRITELRKSGLTCEEISKQENMKISNVYRYSADVDITPKGKNKPVYFDEFTLEKCLEKINK
jgi:hypothetical protein